MATNKHIGSYLLFMMSMLFIGSCGPKTEMPGDNLYNYMKKMEEKPILNNEPLPENQQQMDEPRTEAPNRTTMMNRNPSGSPVMDVPAAAPAPLSNIMPNVGPMPLLPPPIFGVFPPPFPFFGYDYPFPDYPMWDDYTIGNDDDDDDDNFSSRNNRTRQDNNRQQRNRGWEHDDSRKSHPKKNNDGKKPQRRWKNNDGEKQDRGWTNNDGGKQNRGKKSDDTGKQRRRWEKDQNLKDELDPSPLKNLLPGHPSDFFKKSDTKPKS